MYMNIRDCHQGSLLSNHNSLLYHNTRLLEKTICTKPWVKTTILHINSPWFQYIKAMNLAKILFRRDTIQIRHLNENDHSIIKSENNRTFKCIIQSHFLSDILSFVSYMHLTCLLLDPTIYIIYLLKYVLVSSTRTI